MRICVCTFVTAALIVFVGNGALGQCCGDCNGDGKVTVNELVTAVNRALEGCSDDGVCNVSVATCAAQLDKCQGDLASCRTQSNCRAFPSTGQTSAYGSGSDGDVQAGAALLYTDNGDGTITDNNTGLMWEKKDDSGGIHGKDNTYTWGMTSEPYTMNGTIVTKFLITLNAPPCFAGHCDWRIPNVKELQSILDYGTPSPGPVVNTAFHNTAGCPRCTDVMLASCSCTSSGTYWSSTSGQGYPFSAWVVPFFFNSGVIYPLGASKSGVLAVRAVRGGL